MNKDRSQAIGAGDFGDDPREEPYEPTLPDFEDRTFAAPGAEPGKELSERRDEPPLPAETDLDETLERPEQLDPTVRHGEDPPPPPAREDEPVEQDGHSRLVAPSAAVPSPVPLKRGLRLGEYELTEKLGEGGQGPVWKAVHEEAGDCALKFTLGEHEHLLKLTHRGIVRCYMPGTTDGHSFLPMEYLGGSNLREFVEDRDSGLDAEECIWVLRQLAEALDFAHKVDRRESGSNRVAGQEEPVGILHGDIKPANLMLRKPVTGDLSRKALDLLVLCDFGVATSAHARGSEAPVGTLSFMAPEVLLWGQRAATRASDLWGLAATIYYLVKREPPIKRPRDPWLAQARVHNEPAAPPLGSGNKRLDHAIAKALSADPQKRQASAVELLREASGGGYPRTEKGRYTFVLATTVMALAAVLAWFLLIQPKRVQIFSPQAEQVITHDSIQVDFEVDSTRVPKVLVGFAGFMDHVQPQETGQGGEFDANVTVPKAVRGKAVLQVTDEQGTMLRSVAVVVDRGIEEPKVELAQNGDFEESEPIEFQMSFSEPVTIILPDETPVWEPDDYKSKFRFELRPPEGKRGPDPVDETISFKVRDRAGHVRGFETPAVRVYSKAALMLAFEKELEALDRSWHPWDLRALDEELGAWDERLDRAVRQERLEKSDVVTLRENVRERRQRLASLWRSRGRMTLEIVEPATAVGAGTYRLDAERRVIYTREALGSMLSVRGRHPGSLGPKLEWAYADQADTTPLSRDVPGFTVRFKLSAVLGKLTLDGLGQDEAGLRKYVEPPRADEHRTTYQVIVDEENPTLSLVSSPLVNTTPYELRVRVEDEHTSRVALSEHGTAFEPAPGEPDVWRLSVDLEAGNNRFDVRAEDRAGRKGGGVFTVRLDPEAPPAPTVTVRSGPLEAGRSALIQVDYSEPVHLDWTVEWSAPDAPSSGALEPVVVEASSKLEPARRSHELPFDVPDFPDLKVSLTLRATDEAGNRALDTEHEWSAAYDEWGDAPKHDGWTVTRRRHPGRWPKGILHEDTGVEFVWVAPPEGAPTHGMPGFYIARTEVSVDQFLRGGGDRMKRVTWNDDEEDHDCPVEFLGGAPAWDWCSEKKWGHRYWRLPTRSEWIWAAQGPDGRTFPWGEGRDDPPVNIRGQLRVRSKPLRKVDSLPEGASWCGAVQMAGNVGELCVFDPPPGVRPKLGTEFIISGGSWEASELDKVEIAFEVTAPRDLARAGFRPVIEP